jgi:uncharacterized repeat protein (TIGR03803 family)
MSFASLKSSHMFAAFVAATVVLTFAWATTPAQAQTYTILYQLTGDPNPGIGVSFALGRDGNFYASSYYGGANNLGSIFKVTPSGTETLLYSFTSVDGGSCYAGLLLGTDGNFYGGCSSGSSGNGYTFKLTPSGTYTHLHEFAGTDGSGPAITLQGTDGNYYGCTGKGGVNNLGTVFKMTPAGTVTTIYQFDGSAWPCSGLIQGKDGNFYGTTTNGGGVFKLTSAGVYTVLHAFAGGTGDGGNPGGLAQGTDGNFYGGTYSGGTNNEGVIYKMTPAGTVTLLHSFNLTTDLGENPQTNLLQANDGNFYSVAVGCNYFGCGSYGNIFEITPTGTYTTLQAFTFGNGAYPWPGLVLDPSGVFYGLTNQGGTTGNGVFYSLSTGLKAFVSLGTTSGKEGVKVNILGQGFSSSSVVKFGGTQSTTVTRSGTTFLTATVPAAALTGSVTVTTGATTLTSLQTFKVKPTLTSFTPPSGPSGTLVTITGTGLTQTMKVTFNGKSATFTVISDTQVTATVPTGATTGKIAITTKGGSAASTTSFTVN